MSKQPIGDNEFFSDPEEERDNYQYEDCFTDTQSLCHWNHSTETQIQKNPNIFRSNLTNRQKINAVMLCKQLSIESPYSNLEVEIPEEDWYIHKEKNENGWNQVLGLIIQANCPLISIKRVSQGVYTGISNSLRDIQFLHLTVLIIEAVPIQSLEVLTLLDAPNLYRLTVEKTSLTSTKSIHKTNFTKIKMRVCTAQFPCHHTKGNMVLMGLYGPSADFMFQVKMESNNAIANMKQSFKLETDDLIRDIRVGLNQNRQSEFVREWNKKYSLVMKKCKRILGRCGENEDAGSHHH